MTNAVLQVSLNYGTKDSNFELSDPKLWGKHRPTQLCFMSIMGSFLEFQTLQMYLTRAYRPNCWILDVTRDN